MESYLDGLDGPASGPSGDHDANNGPLDLLINAIAGPSASTDQQEQRRQDTGDGDHVQHETQSATLADSQHYDPSLAHHDAVDEYGQDAAATAAAEAAAAAYASSNAGRPYHDLAMLEDAAGQNSASLEQGQREASHSIQGLLAASKFLGGQQSGAGMGAAAAGSEYLNDAEHQDLIPTSSNLGKRRATSPPHQDIPPRHGKIARLFAATTGPNGARIPEQSMSFSTVTLLHGHVAQKSYGPEKRFLAPPPVIRMNGSVADTVDTMTLALVNNDVGPLIPLISNVQGVNFNVPGREEEARGMVREGMGFPALYASITGKAKTVKLKLNVFQPGGTEWRLDDMGNPILPVPLQTGDALPEGERVQPKLNRTARKPPPSRGKGKAKDELSAVRGVDGGQQSHQSSAEQSAVGPPGHQELHHSGEFDVSQQGLQAGQEQRASVPALPSGEMTMADMTHDPELTMNDATALEQNVAMMEGAATSTVNTPGGDDAAMDVETDDQPAQNQLVEDMNALTDDKAVRPWATFESAPLSVLSKPTKTTQKVRSLGPPLSVTSTVALWSRINSQAVRTKYMMYEHGRMIGRPSEWSAFVIDVIKRGTPGPGEESKHPAASDEKTLCYGSIVSIREKHSGLRTEPLLMCKVVSGELQLRCYDPVNQLEKIAFAKVVNGQGRWYLRAPGKARERFDEETGKPMPRIRKRQKGARDTFNEVVKKRVAPALDQEENDEEGPVVKFALPKISVQQIDGQEVRTEYIDDFLCWSINGVTETTWTFFEGRHDLGDFSTVFKKPLTPLPTLLEEPTYRFEDHTVTLTVTDFYYDDDDVNFRGKPLLVYLGAIGPLTVRTFRSMAREEGLPLPPEQAGIDMKSYPSVQTDGGEDIPPEERPYSSIPSTTPHDIIVVQLPPAIDIWEATRIERERQLEIDSLRGLDDEMMDIDDMAMFENINFDIGPPTSVAQPSQAADVNTETTTDGMKVEQGQGEEEHPVEQNMDDNAYAAEEPQMPGASAAQPNPDAANGDHDTHGGLNMRDHNVNDQVHAGTQDIHSQTLEEHAIHLGQVDGSSLHDMSGHNSHQHHDQHDVMQQLLDPRLGDLPELEDMSGDYIASFEAAAAALSAAQEGQHLHDMHADMHAAAAAAAMLAPDTSLADVHSAMHAEMLGGGDGTQSPMTGEHLGDTGALGPHGYEPESSALADATNASKKGKGKAAGGTTGRKGRPAKPKPPVPVDENGNRIKKKRVLATRPKLEPNPSAASEPPQLRITDKALSALTKGRERHGELGHSSLPLLFVRPSDGTGYHSGKNVAIEKIEGTVMEPEGWIIRVV